MLIGANVVTATNTMHQKIYTSAVTMLCIGNAKTITKKADLRVLREKEKPRILRRMILDCTCPVCLNLERLFKLRFWSVVFFVMGIGSLVLAFWR